MDAEAGPQHAVEGGGRAAALDVPEHGDARLVAGLCLDEVRELQPDAAQAHVAEFVQLLGGGRFLGAELGAFGDDDDGEVLVLCAVPVLDVLANLVNVDRPLGDEDHVRAARHPGVHGDPARVPAHHLADDDALVRLGGRVEPVDGLGGDLHRGVETESEIGAGEIVVDGLGNSDHFHAHRGELGRDPERVLAADRHHRADVEVLEVAHDDVGPVRRLLERIGARGAEDGTAEMQRSARGLAGEPEMHRRIEQAAPPFADAHHFQTVLLASADDSADDRIETRTIAAPRQDRDFHGSTSLLARRSTAIRPGCQE